MKKKESGKGRLSERQRCGLLAFAAPVLIMLLIFLVRGIYPFGDRSFLFSDMYHQYVPFFRELSAKLKAGESLAYSWNAGIGSDFLALYGYYLATPWYFLLFRIDEAYICEVLSYLVVIKIGLCGLTGFLYLEDRGGRRWALMLSLGYAFSGYLAAYSWNVMWLDGVILAPLVLLGLERLVKEGRCGLYCGMLALSILTNYYLSILLCIFLIFYFFLLLFAERERIGALQALIRFGLSSLLAGALCGVLLVPVAAAMTQTRFASPDFPKQVTSYFPLLDVLARHCVIVSGERGLNHWPNIYCGVAALFLIPAYVANDRIPNRRKFGFLALAGFLLLSFSVNVLNFFWHGMNFPDSLPARQSFLYILLVLAMCQEALAHLEELSPRQIVGCYLGASAFLLFCEKFAPEDEYIIGAELVSFLFVTAYAMLFYFFRTRQDGGLRRALLMLAFLVMAAEALVNTVNTGVGTTSRSAYLENLPEYRELYENYRPRGEFYRFEKLTRKTKNDGMLAGYPTASLFSSSMNAAVMEFYRELGMRNSKVYYCYDGATPLAAALLNVRYLFGESKEYETGLLRPVDSRGDVYLYENQASLPFGYVAPAGYDIPVALPDNGLLLQNDMVQALGLGGQLLFRTGYSKEERGDRIEFTAGADGYYYGLVTDSGTKRIEASGGPVDGWKYQDLKKGSVLCLGYLKEGDRFFLKNGDEKDATPKIAVDFYRMDEEVLSRALEILSARHLEEVSVGSDFLTGRLSLEEEGRLILSVPYERGWRVTINGEPAEPELFGGAFMAFDLAPGEYVLTMRYRPYGLSVGRIVSVASVLAAAAWIAAARRRKKAEPLQDGTVTT